MSISGVLVTGLELAINRCLAFDATTQSRLATLSGKVIGLELVGLGVVLYVLPSLEKVQVQAEAQQAPDVVLRGTPVAFARMGLEDEAVDRLFAGDITLQGDTELGQRFGEIIKGMDIEWEEMAARVMGDVLAHKLGDGVRAGLNLGQKVLHTLEQDTSEYLQEELRELPPREELEVFLQDIDTLRNDVERMAARVQRLQRQLDPDEA